MLVFSSQRSLRSPSRTLCAALTHENRHVRAVLVIKGKLLTPWSRPISLSLRVMVGSEDRAVPMTVTTDAYRAFRCVSCQAPLT